LKQRSSLLKKYFLFALSFWNNTGLFGTDYVTKPKNKTNLRSNDYGLIENREFSR